WKSIPWKKFRKNLFSSPKKIVQSHSSKRH
ncbi:hypothetical protein CWATWH0402_840, partial [Crocosphaera watsonii WH 0402]